jgi:hypothetical protein
LADSFPEGEDAEGFLDTAQGNVEGMMVLGLVKDAFQAGLKEVQFIQERGLMALPGLVGDVGQGPAQMFGMAGEGRDGKPVPGGQGTQGLSGDQGAVDLLEAGVSADGTAFIHGMPLFYQLWGGTAGPASRSRNSASRGQVYLLGGQGASTVVTDDRKGTKPEIIIRGPQFTIRLGMRCR